MDGFALQFYALYQMENTQERNRQNVDGMEALKSRGKGTKREALLWGDKIEWCQRKPTWTGVLISVWGGGGRVRPISPSH